MSKIPENGILTELGDTIADRVKHQPPGSYISQLLEDSTTNLSKKVIEEATEVILAATEKDRGQLVYEAADLMFHLFVLLGAFEIRPEAVLTELGRRQDVSGLAEKAARQGKANRP